MSVTRLRSPSPSAVLAVLLGAVVSSATQCGPADPEADTADAAGRAGGSSGGTDEPDPGFSRSDSAPVTLTGEGDVQTLTVRARLSERCLSESPDYAWGYPAGWVVMGYELATALAPDDTASPPAPPPPADTADTGAPDDSADTGADTGAPEDSADTGADTGAPDDTADTGDTAWDPSAAARVEVTITDAAGTILAVDRMSLPDGDALRDNVTVERPYLACAPDAPCDVAWTVAFRLVAGAAASGDLDLTARLNFCSSGVPESADLDVSVE